MKHFLLPEGGSFYKAAMHIHTTISDGRLSPEEMKRIYKDAGYSVVAFTDHQVFVTHNDFTEPDFLPINSFEFAVNDPATGILGWETLKSYHLNLYARTPDIDYSSICSDRAIWLSQSHQHLTARMRENPRFPVTHSVESINHLIEVARSEGFLVCYNHPLGCRHDYNDYAGLRGLWGIEWYNHGSNACGCIETIGPMDDLLHRGERVFPIAADDSHSRIGCLGGFTMIKAPALDYASVIGALERGDFYSSTAPLIHDLTIEDGILRVRTSEASRIFVSTERRAYFAARADGNGAPLTEAAFDLNPFIQKSRTTDALYQSAFFRVTVYDAHGGEAHTRAYFLTEPGIAD